MVHQKFAQQKNGVARTVSEQDVWRFAESNSWLLISDQPGDVETGQRRQLVWERVRRPR